MQAERYSTDGEWNFEEVMAVIEKEIDARERAGATFVTTTRNHGIKDLLTTAALISGDSSSVCCSYCGHSHSSVSCKIVIGSDAWKQVRSRTALKKESSSSCASDESVNHQKHGRNIVSYPDSTTHWVSLRQSQFDVSTRLM